jgi:hypothetical protein
MNIKPYTYPTVGQALYAAVDQAKEYPLERVFVSPVERDGKIRYLISVDDDPVGGVQVYGHECPNDIDEIGAVMRFGY